MTDYLKLIDQQDGAQPKDDEANPYLAVIDSIDREQQARTKTILDTALKDNPDLAAERNRLSVTTGLPPDMVKRNMDELRIKERAAAIDLVAMANESPILYRQLSDPNFAAVVVDDVFTLKNIESTFKAGAAYAMRGDGGLADDVGGALQTVALGATAGLGAMEFDAVGVFWDVLGFDQAAADARGRANDARSAINDMGFQAKTETGRAIKSGLTSAGQNLALLPLGLERSLFQTANAAATAVAGVMSVGVGAEAYNRAREEGHGKLKAAAYAIPEATFEFVFERIPAKQLFGDLANNTSLMRMLGNQAISEGWTEQVTTLFQDFNGWMNLNPDKTLAEFIAERPAAAYQTFIATLVGVGVQTTTIHGINKLVEKASGQQLKFEQDVLAEQMRLAGESALRERSPEQFREFMKSASNTEDGAREIHIDGQVLNQLPQELLSQLPEAVRAQIADAALSQSTVAIPIADVLTIAPGTELEQIINDNARARPDSPSKVESAMAGELLVQEAERIIQQAADQQGAQESSNRVREGLLAQLTTVNRFRPAVNDVYATWATAFYTTMAGRIGITPEEMAARFPLRITGQTGAGAALNQDDAVVEDAGSTPAPASIKQRLTAFSKRLGFAGNATPADVLQQPQVGQPDDGGSSRVLGPRGTFDTANMELALNSNADLSTFIHETGHFFLEVMTDLASQPNAPAQIQEDMAALLKWFGVEEEQWIWMQLDEKRKYHERFAESIEQYLLEGRAPNLDLQPLFRRAAVWMKTVYANLKSFIDSRQGATDIQLSDEVRQVFDRMLATDAQIREAEDVAGLLPNDDATLSAMETLAARSLRDLKWTVNARAKAIKALQQQAVQLRAAVEGEVRAEIEAQDVYAARAKIRGGSKLDVDVIAEMYTGEADRYALLDWSPLVQQKLAGKDGQHPDMIAGEFNFDSGDALIKALIEAQPIKEVIQAETDKRMLEQYGDLTDQATIEQAANEAVHNEARAKSLAAELKAQTDALNATEDTGRVASNGRPITVNALVQAAKMFGQRIVARTPLKDLKRTAAAHLAAERRAAKAWAEYTKKAKTLEAIQAKRDQVLNHAAARAALDARIEMGNIFDFFRRVAKGGNKSTVEKGRDPDVVNAARAILAAYGLNQAGTKTAAEYMEIVRENDPATFDALQDSMLGALRMAQPIDALTMDELRMLHEEIQHMWDLAKRMRQMEVDGNMMDIEDAEQELRERLEKLDTNVIVPGQTGAMTAAEEAGRKLQYAGSAWRRMEQWTEAMDGGYDGPFKRWIYRPIKLAATAYRADRTIYRKKMETLVNALKPHLRRDNINAHEIGYVFGKGKGGGHVELLHAILHTGNESNKRKLLLGGRPNNPWATVNQDGSLDTSAWDAFIKRMQDTGVLTKAHYDFAQDVWNLNEEVKPLAQKAHRYVFGRYFDEVTANSFETPFGAYAGGYVPAQADPRLAHDADMRALANAENQSMNQSFPSQTKMFTTRVEYNRPLILNLNTIGQHLDKVLLFAHMAPAVGDVTKLLRQKGFSGAMSRFDPTVFSGLLLPWLNTSARQSVEAPISGSGGIERILSVLRNNSGLALMFGNLSNVMQQISGFPQAWAKFIDDGMKADLMRSTAKFISNPKKMARDVAAASDFMAGRMTNDIAAMNGAINEILFDPRLYEKAQALANKHGYFLQAAMANTMEPIIWTAGYNAHMAKHGDSKAAAEYADGVIRQTQGSLLPEDVSRIETGPATARFFTQFYSYFSMIGNTNTSAFQKVAREIGLKKGAGKILGLTVMGLLVPIWIASFIAVAMRGGPDDPDDDGYLDDWLLAVFGFGTAKSLVAMVPLVGQVGNAAINRMNDNPADDKIGLSPAIGMFESGMGAWKIFTVEEIDRRNVRDVASLLSLTGIPVTAAARPLGYWADVASDKVEPTGPLDALRGTVTGTPSPESKGR